uniref:Uncharacterized protein n=1 Tax=Arundo donax TaxID=35708 RepID=A0A0A8ZDY0_ARUDO
MTTENGLIFGIFVSEELSRLIPNFWYFLLAFHA